MRRSPVASPLSAAPRRRRRRPRAAVNVVATTEDLAALTREVGGDKVKVEAIAKGYQDPHFVEAKPSFILKLPRRRPPRGRGPRAGDRLAAPAHPAEPQREDPARGRRLPRRFPHREDPRDPHRARSPGPWATSTPSAIPHYWLDPDNGRQHREGHRGEARAQMRPPTRPTSPRATPTSTSAWPRPRSGGTA